MSEYYTNVQLSRGNILLRGIRDGKPFKDSFKYKPYHFIPSKEVTEYQTTDGKYLRRMDFDTVNEAKDFITKYDGVENFTIYGYGRYLYNFIHDTYGSFQPTQQDLNDVSVVYIDIETAGNTYDLAHYIQVRSIENPSKTIETQINGLYKYYDKGYEVFDEERDSWIDFENSCYARSNGFPHADQAANPITAVAFRKGKLKIVIGTVDFTPENGEIYIRCRDEKELLFKLIDVWTKLNPDVVTGWNIEFFDIPYIINRITDIIGESFAKQLSPWLQIHDYTTKDGYGNEKKSYRIIGITCIDLMAAYIKFSFKNQEAYTLNHIAYVELGEEKIDYSNYENLQDLYLKNPQLFIVYNIQDNDLVERINIKTGLINQIMSLAYDAQINYADAFTSVLLWEVIIKNHLQDKNIIVPSKGKKNYKNEPIMGAFVKNPRPGKHKWVIGLDLDSLYPHLIMQYNISPETFVKCMKDLRHSMDVDNILAGNLKKNSRIRDMIDNQNVGYTPNGAFFKNDVRGFLPALMDTMYSDRKRYKQLMTEYKIKNNKNKSVEWEMMIAQYNNMQMAKKICLNSAYGALSNEWFMWYDIDLAEAITYAGQLAIKWVSKDLNDYLNKLLSTEDVDYVIANDTDSAYLTMDALVQRVMPDETDKKKIVEFLNKVCSEKINPYIEKSYEKLRDYTNAYEQKMSMKVESISEAGLWKAKKHYALNVWWDEGVFYDKPKLKVKGLKVVQASTPAVCKPVMNKSIALILTDDKVGLTELVNNFEVEFKKASFENICFTTKINDLQKYADPVTVYGPRSGPEVRGALYYNKMLKEQKIDHKYQYINSGDKMKTCYLRMPNPVGNDSMSIFNRLPKEFGVEKYIDYDKQFENEFLKPINELAKLVGWDLKNTATLDSFFG